MMTTSAADLQVGRVLGGRYRLIACIGSGASAHVYLADDTTLRRRVAVKILRAAVAGEDTFLRRFRAEAQAAAALNHPHILAVHDWGNDDGPYLVTEYLGGGSLRALLDSGTRLTPSQAVTVGLAAARGLDHAHRRGLVHRDIKPANLLFDEEGRLRIADFGLARALAEASVTEPTGSVIGTYRYASPEQAKGLPVDQRSDVYALALVLCEAVTGTVPFAADTSVGTLMARVDATLVPPIELGPLRPAVARAADPDPELRPDAGEFATALMAAAEGLPRPKPLPLAGAISPASRIVDHGRDLTVVAPTAAVTTPTRNESATPERPSKRKRGSAATAHEVAAGDIPGLSRRRRRGPRALLAVLLLAAAGIGGYAVWSAVAGEKTHAIPEVISLSPEEASETLEDLGYDVATAGERSPLVGAGQVIRTEPAEGIELAEGETVTLVVSDGPPLVLLPDVANITIEQAIARLDEYGLVAGPQVPGFDDVVPPNSVIRLDVADGATELPQGSEVTLVISQGPAPRAIPAGLTGLTYDEAAAQLTGVRLVPARLDACSDTVAVGAVISVNPAEGVEVPADSAVEISVSDGLCEVEVPNVDGETLADAKSELELAGFEVNVTGDVDGTVFGQTPDAGALLRPGERVTIALA